MPKIFGQKLTWRHFLARRSVWLLGGSLLGLCGISLGGWLVGLVPLGAPPTQSADQPGQAEVAERGETGGVRYLPVATAVAREAGPELLPQTYTGIVKAKRSSRLSTKTVGRIEAIHVDVGDHVQQGELLIELDTQQLRSERNAIAAKMKAAEAVLLELKRGPRRQEVQQAEARVAELQANLRLSEANLARLVELKRTSAISQQQFDESSFQVDALQAQLDAAKEALDLLSEGTREEQIQAQQASLQALQAELARIDVQLQERQVLAPFSGTIRQRLADEGTIVSPASPLLEILETDHLEVHVGLPPEIARDIRALRSELVSQERILGCDVERISPAIDQRTRTRQVSFRLEPAARDYLAVGAAVQVRVYVPPAKGGLWVPTDALTVGTRGLWAVYVLQPERDQVRDQDIVSVRQRTQETRARPGSGQIPLYRVERRQVELLRSQSTWSQVQGPVSKDEWIIVEGVHRVVPDQLVTRLDEIDTTQQAIER